MDMKSALQAMTDGDVLDTEAVQSRLGLKPDGDGAQQLLNAEDDSQLLVDLG